MKYLALAFILLPSLAFAQGFVPLSNAPGLQNLGESPDIATLFNNIYMVCIGIGASLAIFQFVRAGIKYSSNTGNQSEVTEAKKMISDTVFGLVLLLSPFVILSMIDERMLSLDLNFSGLSFENSTLSDSQWVDGDGVTHQNAFSANSSLPQCQIGNSTFPPISDGFDFSLPSGQELADCCTNQGYNVVPTGPPVGSSIPGAGNVECLSDEALAARQAQTQPDPSTTAGTQGLYTLTLSISANSYMLVYGKVDTAQDPQCYEIAYGGFETAAVCETARTRDESLYSSWSRLRNCDLHNQGGYMPSFPIQQSQAPFCSEQAVITP